MKKLGIFMGINDYPGTSNDLSGCVNDANDWAQAWKTRSGFDTLTFRDNKCTITNMKYNIKEMLSQLGEGDMGIIQYSGHGSFIPDLDGDEPDKRDECLVPYDYDNGLLLDDELYKIFLTKHPKSKVVFISDSCHSGTVCRMFATGESTTKVRFMPPETFMHNKKFHRDHQVFKGTSGFVQKLLYNRSPVLLLAGCQDTEYSYDASFRNRPNGAFSYFALKELKRMPKGSTFGQWFDQLRKTLPSQEYPQTPNMIGTKEQCNWSLF